ncbi:hypothetical protein APHAL10511_006145 [Amanita phalloides]|nr:hypothetical protein APHAL10511_006145 [Amanita phalloides]
MDELLHHCLRELSFDGNLGCNITRLRDFILGCYSNLESPVGQNTDDAFCAFVWSLIVQHPTVQVGLKPPDATSEIWVAPQTSTKRKVKTSGEEAADVSSSKLTPVTNAENRPLTDLVQEYGDNLRIAVEPEAIYAAITGTHIRSSKLSPMVYTALQIITRGRDNGVSVVELGQKTKYDQKTCFYLVKQLTELDLVIKVRRGGVGTHFCIHKYFFERNPSWKAIREEEIDAGEGQRTKNIGEEAEEGTVNLDFSPIDARHLSSLPLVRARVVKLLQVAKNQIHPSNNMLVTIGFANPTKTDRRFFQSRIRELLQQGIVEKVVVPSRRRKSGSAYVKCLRLVTGDKRRMDGESISSPEPEDDKDEIEQEGIKVNITVHRQVIDLLEASGTDGMTLQDISMALGDFDKRTLELILTRAERYPPPSHLKDLGVVSLMETSGRERRHRYFTTRAYQELLSKEKFEAPGVLSNADFTHTKEFSPLEEVSFYAEKQMLQSYQDGYQDKINVAKPRKRPLKNPILPDGRVKLGRPRKKPAEQTVNSESKTIVPGTSTTPPMIESLPVKKRRIATTSLLPDEAPQVSQKRGRQKVKRTSSVNIQKSKKRIRPEESVGNEAETAPRKRIKVSGSGSVDQGPGEGRSDGTREWIGPEKLLQHDKHAEAVTQASFEKQGVISIVSGCNVEDQDSAAVAPCSAISGHITQGATPDAEVLRPSVSVPIDPELLADQASSSTDSLKPVVGTPASARGKVNVSHLRRENEIYRVISEQGGIVNIQSKEFYAAHKVLIEALVKAGEATSAPVGTTLDKRTLATTLDGLERRGRIKQLRSSIVSHTGVSRPVCVVYLPDMTQEELNNFLADLSRSQLPSLASDSYLKIDEPVEFGVNEPSTPRNVLPLELLQLEQPGDDRKERWSKNTARARQLFSYDEDTIRSVLLMERNTLSQSYGWIVGKVARARCLHLSTLRVFEVQEDTRGMICREHKIVDLSYYCHEIPLELYCSLISVLQHDEHLKQFLGTADGRQTHVRNLSAHFHSFLQIGRSRARSRFLEILEVLWLLNLVVPIRLSKSESSSICCSHTGNDQVFEPVNFTSSSFNTLGTHSYWKFQSQAPISLSGPSAQVQKHVPVATEAEGRDYWKMLQELCTNTDSPPEYLESGADNSESRVSLIRSLRRASSWASEYVFTWHQTQYMKQFIDYHTARTPLQEENEVQRTSNISRIAWVMSAPEEAVRSFFSAHHSKVAMVLERSEKKPKQRNSGRKARATAEAKTSLAKKAAEAQQQREQGWEDLVSRLHPSPIPAAAVVRLKRIRTRFMQAASTQDQSKWENELNEAFCEADLITRNLPRISETSTSQLPLPLNGEKSVEVLIAQQGPALSVQTIQGGKRRRGDEAGEKIKTGQRRPRFLWNHDYDELAQDAAVIIRARCRGLSRLDWGAFEQVFPAVPRNTVRQRLAHIRESPSDEAYLNRLEEQWHELWLRHKGTSVLPDEDPSSPTNFDLAKHVEVLRAHIDKNALRVGFAQSDEKSSPIIPFSVDALLSKYTIGESTPSVPLFDFMWNTAVEEGREKRLMHKSFTMHPEEVALNLTTSSDSVSIAEATLKMVLGMPHERYDAERASNLMRSAGESAIECARKNLLERGVLSKLVRDPQKQKPGRQLKISEASQNAIGGLVSRDTFQDAASLEGLSRQEYGWREWPLLATDGDAAALVQAVSENKVKFKVDTSQAQAARPRLDWNSKKADDDQIETTILVKFDPPGDDEPLSPPGTAEVPNDSPSSHPSTVDGVRRCCKGQTVNGLVDCEACLEDEWTSIYSSFDEEEKGVAQRILDIVREAGAKGISKSRLRDLIHLADHRLFNTVHHLIDAAIPIIFWTGYDTTVLAHSIYLSKWTVIVSDDPLTRLHPRRWYDIEGYRIPAYWEAALRCVMGLVIFRPGITQYEMRWRLRTVYDRQELNDILGFLSEEGYLRTRQKDGSCRAVLPLDDAEELGTFWITGHRAWYRV